MSQFTVEAIIKARNEAKSVLKDATNQFRSMAKAAKSLESPAASFSKMANGFKGFSGDIKSISVKLQAQSAEFRKSAKEAERYAAALKEVAKASGGIQTGRGFSRWSNGRDDSKRPEHWRNLKSRERLGWRAETAAQYSGLYGAARGVGVTASNAGKGISEGSTNRSLNSLLLAGSPELKVKLESEASRVSGEYKTQSAAGLQEAGRGALFNLKDVKELPKAMEAIGRGAQLLTGMTGDAKKAQNDISKIVKTADISGLASTSEGIERIINANVKSMLMGGADLKAEQIKSVIKSAGSAKRGLNDDSYLVIGSLADEFGQKGGEMIRMFADDLTRANLAKVNKEKLEKAGLRDKDGAVDAKTLQANPFEWIEKNVIPQLKKMNIDLDDASQVTKGVNALGFLKGSGELVKYYADKRDEIKNLLERSKGIDISKKAAKNLPNTDVKSANSALLKQFENSADALTKDIVPIYTSAISKFADFLSSIAQNPEKGKTSALGVGVLGLGLQAGKIALEVDNKALIASNSILTAAVLTNARATGIGAATGIAGAASGGIGGLVKGAVFAAGKLTLWGAAIGAGVWAIDKFSEHLADVKQRKDKEEAEKDVLRPKTSEEKSLIEEKTRLQQDMSGNPANLEAIIAIEKKLEGLSKVPISNGGLNDSGQPLNHAQFEAYNASIKENSAKLANSLSMARGALDDYGNLLNPEKKQNMTGFRSENVKQEPEETKKIREKIASLKKWREQDAQEQGGAKPPNKNALEETMANFKSNFEALKEGATKQKEGADKLGANSEKLGLSSSSLKEAATALLALPAAMASAIAGIKINVSSSGQNSSVLAP
jgi:hypothetical protein